MNSILSELLSTFYNSNNLSKKPRIPFLSTLGVTLLVTTALFPIVFVISLLVNQVSPELVDNNAVNQLVESSSFLVIILLGGLIAPVTEEIAFRSWFSRDPAPFFFGVGLLLLFGLNSVPIFIYRTDVVLGLIIHLLISFVPIFVAYLIPSSRKAINNFIDTYRSYIAAIGIIIFALIHVSNWTDLPLEYIPLFVLPQLLAGYVFQYTASRFSWIHAIISHIYYNVMLLLTQVPLTKSFTPEELISIQNGNFVYSEFTSLQAFAYISSSIALFVTIFGGASALIYLLVQHIQETNKNQSIARDTV